MKLPGEQAHDPDPLGPNLQTFIKPTQSRRTIKALLARRRVGCHMVAIFYQKPWQLQHGQASLQDQHKSIGVWKEEFLAFSRQEPPENSIWVLEALLTAER